MNMEAELEKARAAVEEWEAKAAAARQEAADLDAGAGAEILADPAAAERITLRVQAKEREARAYDAAAAEARSRVDDVHRRGVRDELRRVEKEAAAARREADKHRAKVDGLLDQLEKLQGARYAPVYAQPARLDGDVYRPADDGPEETVLDDLEGRATYLEEQAAGIREVLETGKWERIPNLFVRPGGRVPLPPVTRAALDAGMTIA